MRARLAALAVGVVICAVAMNATAADVPNFQLTLEAALERVAETHPDLRVFGARQQALIAEQERASQPPALRAGIEIENALGRGEARGLSGAELTLSLSGVLERGGKLDARAAFARSRFDALAVERETRRLDLMAEVARRYLAIVAANATEDLARVDIEQRQGALEAVTHRVRAGALHDTEALSAEVALIQAQRELRRAEQRGHAAQRRLAMLWGEPDAQFTITAPDPLRLAEIADESQLGSFLEQTPELTGFASAQRTAEARLRLARSEASADWEWQVGVRRLQGTQDDALVGGLSLALGSRQRAEPERRSAEAELEALSIEREGSVLGLRATLIEAHERYRRAQDDVSLIGEEILPRLVKAEAAAARAFRSGAISHQDWARQQDALIAARRERVGIALDAHAALIEIQRLTGQSFRAESAVAHMPETRP